MRMQMSAVIAAVLALGWMGPARAQEGWMGRGEPEGWEEPLHPGQVKDFLRKHNPPMLEELAELHRHNPEAFEREFREVAERVRHLREVAKHHPEMAGAMIQAERLEHETHRLAGAIAKTDDEDKREQMAGKLREMLNRIFDARLAEGKLEIMQLEREIQEIKETMERREAAREQIIERRFKTLLAEADETMRWW